MSPPSAEPLVYGDLDGSLVALRETRARELAAIHEAIGDVATWEELRARIPAADFQALLRLFDDPPALDEPFDPQELGPLADGDWPEWPQQGMLDLVPKEMQRELGKVEFSMVSGDCLVIPFERESEFVSALSERGSRSRRDDDLVRRASGYSEGRSA